MVSQGHDEVMELLWPSGVVVQEEAPVADNMFYHTI
jgi:hypothetical protein